MSLQQPYQTNHYQPLIALFEKHIRQYYEGCLTEQQPVREPNVNHQDLLDRLDQWKQNTDLSFEGRVDQFLDLVMKSSMRLHHPKYMGHQVSAPLPLAALFEWLSAVINNGGAIFDMGPLETVLEKVLSEWVAGKIGWDASKAGGFLTSGGSLGNMSALLVATNRYRESGRPIQQAAVLVPESTHYSSKRALSVLGFEEKQIVKIPVNSQFKMEKSQVEHIYQQTKQAGFDPFMLVANACSTATGSFDDLNEMADVCEKMGMWLHIDAAHGGPCLLSPSLKQKLLKGIERADSVVMDYHKMMLMPALATSVVFKRYQDSYYTAGQEASYLFANQSEDLLWLDLGRRTIECTKHSMAFKVYACLHLYGESYFADYLEHCHHLSQHAYQRMEATGLFDLPHKPDFNILCYRLKNKTEAWHQQVVKSVLQKGEYYLVSTQLNGQFYLRSTWISPTTTLKHVDDLIDFLINLP
jgi:L-2,4-diaminobutyrate decarboxylase